MRRLKLFLVLTAALVAAAPASGCARIDITCGIGRDHTATLRYDCVFDTGALRAQDVEPARQAVARIAEHLTGQGFAVTVGDGADRSWTLTAVREQACGSPEAAAEALRDWMTDPDVTPFETTSVQWTSTDYERAYYLRATLNLTGLLEGNDAETMPPDIAALYERGVGEASGRLILLLPGDELLQCDGEAEFVDGLIRCARPLSLSEPVTVTLMTGLQRSAEPWTARLAALTGRLAWTERRIAPAVALFAVLLAAAAGLGILPLRRKRAGGRRAERP